MTTFMGLPLIGPDFTDGIHTVPSARIRNMVIAPCVIRVENNEITAYGMQPHAWMWEKERVYGDDNA